MTVTEVFVDTVGDPEWYQRKLQGLFSHVTPSIQVIYICTWEGLLGSGDLARPNDGAAAPLTYASLHQHSNRLVHTHLYTNRAGDRD